MNKINRVILIILDGVGIGPLPDAICYGDEGSHTLGNLARVLGGLHLPNLEKLGLGNIDSILGVKKETAPLANYGKMAEKSPGKDSTSGHWELAGYILNNPFPTYPNGFPEEIVRLFVHKSGRGIIGNKPASGTEIIRELGTEHVNSGKVILYTSADSVFQIAAHEDVVSLDELYELCTIARNILTGKHAVSRVIARPFIGASPNTFTRTPDRRDFSLPPPGALIQNCVQNAGITTVGIGKIDDLYAGVGLHEKIHTKSNAEGIAVLLEKMQEFTNAFIMINLVDFDMLCGHRNDPEGFNKELQYFDKHIPVIIQLMHDKDLLVITADHGNDPTTPGTDHSREYVPLLVFGKDINSGINLGTRSTFADLGKTVGDAFDIESCPIAGTSFWPQICQE